MTRTRGGPMTLTTTGLSEYLQETGARTLATSAPSSHAGGER
ncbi:MAG: hypothetical protein R3F14_20820 [Polyangiaceae bacterium]